MSRSTGYEQTRALSRPLAHLQEVLDTDHAEDPSEGNRNQSTGRIVQALRIRQGYIVATILDLAVACGRHVLDPLALAVGQGKDPPSTGL
jgi:hypothetical protein